jgi:RNA polymerase sigma factor (sigma-70 family)
MRAMRSALLFDAHRGRYDREVPVSVDPNEDRDKELVRAIGRGNEEAFRTLFRRYAPSAMAVARRVVGQSYLAEEAVQEGFLALWRNPSAYEEVIGSVRAWLMGTVHHRAVDLVRREEAQRRRAEGSGPDDALAPANDPADEVVDELGLPEERTAVRAALDGLPAEQRQIIELMYFRGLSQSAIAEQLALPLGTVKSRTLLAMRKLRVALRRVDR